MTRLFRSPPVVAVTVWCALAAPAVGAQQTTPTTSASTSTAGRRLTLAEALELAKRSSESVEIAKAGVTRARGQQLQARSAALPQLSASANYQKTLQNQFESISNKTPASTTPDTGSSSGGSLADNPLTKIFASPYTTTLSVTGTQNLYSGGRNKANVRAAVAGRESAEIGVVSAGAQVTLDVTQAYYDAVLSDNLVAIAESSLVQTERTLRATALGQRVGSTSEFELIRARVTRDNQRPQFLQARTARDLTYVRLKQLLDVPIDLPLSLVDDIEQQTGLGAALQRTPAPISQSLVFNTAELTATDPAVTQAVNAVVAKSDTGANSRAPVRQASAAVEAAQQQLKATKAGRLPSVGLTSTYQRLAYPADGIPKSLGDFFPNWTVGLGVSFPFFTGGRVKGETMAAEAGVIEAQQRLQQAKESATLDARQSIMALLEAEEAWQASIGTTEQAARAYSIAEVRFREGISTQVELSESRVQLQQAQANRARAARDLQVARVRMQLLHDLPLGGASAGSGSTAGASSGAAASQSTQRSGQAGASSQTGTPPGGNQL